MIKEAKTSDSVRIRRVIKRETTADKIKKLSDERHDVTMEFMRASRAYKMSVRGLKVLHVINPNTGEYDITPLIKEAMKSQALCKSTQPEVITASSVSDAKEVINREQIDIRIAVIEVDLECHGDGVELAKWIKENHPQLPVLLSTSDEDDVELIHKELPYIDVFLSKTMSTRQLMRIFGCTLEGRQANHYEESA